MNGKASLKSKILLGIYALGIVFGLVMVVLGINTTNGKYGGGTSHLTSSSSDRGYASFGADFYTYVNNNAALAADAAELTVNNLDAISDLLQEALGIIVIAFGGFMVCLFGGKLVEALPDKPAAESGETAADENVPETQEEAASAEPEAPDSMR